jgi:selenide,water dikinase
LRLLLAGGGHSHVEVLRRFAQARPAAVDAVLVAPEDAASYSGMLPGLVAGLYRREETEIPLAPLAQAAGVRVVHDRVAALDLTARRATLTSGAPIPFDVLSLDVGSTPDAAIPGAREHAIAAKPVPAFLAAWERLQQDARAGRVGTIAVVGGGAGGVELVLAMRHRLHAIGAASVRFALVSDRPDLLPQHAPAVGRLLQRVLRAREVDLHLGRAACAVGHGAVMLEGGGRVAADAIVWATSASAAPWLAASGLATDERGFVCVGDDLRSVSHPFVFASGDCATLASRRHPKSGLYAVRHGPPLAHNLLAAADGRAAARYRPQARGLALIGTGGRDAVLSWGPFAARGRWIWRWKERIDRAFIARYTLAANPSACAGAAPVDED